MPEGLLVPLPLGLLVPLPEGLLVFLKGFFVDSFLDILGAFVFLDGALESDGAEDTLGPSEGSEDGAIDIVGVFEGDIDSEGFADGERLGILLSSEVIRMVTVSVEEFPHSSVTVSVATVTPTDAWIVITSPAISKSPIVHRN